jgi:hypothetical protein
MKIKNSRLAISQSMDLFIIIAAVLGVGGVVTAAVFGLANSGANSTTLQIVSASLVGGPSTTSNGSTSTLALSLKNLGTSTINLSQANILNVTTSQKGVSAATASATGSVTWSAQHAGLTNSLIGAYSDQGTVAPGSQITLLLTITTSNTTPAPFASGNQYTINILLPGYTTSIKLTAQ